MPGNVLSFLGPGSAAVDRNLAWHMLICADKADTHQARIQKEIDDVIGRERLPEWNDRRLMPYTMATIMEMHRWQIGAPLGVPRG